MNGEAWSSLVPRAISLPIQVYKQRHTIGFGIKWAQSKLGLGKTNIVILGLPGGGKSVLKDRLAKLASDPEYETPSVSRKVESAVVWLGRRPNILRVLPGQALKERAVGSQAAFVRNKRLHTVIYVCDAGFNKARDETSNRLRVERGTVTIDDLLRENLAAEVTDFSNVATLVRDHILTQNLGVNLVMAVNKCDLFMGHLDAQQAYYHPEGTSEFSAVVRQLQNGVGDERVRITVLPVCSIGEPFEWNGSEIPSQLNENEVRNLFKSFVDGLSKTIEEAV